MSTDIKQAIDGALAKTLVIAGYKDSSTKKQKQWSLVDVLPWELQGFMAANNIPSDARLQCHDDTFFLVYEIDVPLTDQDKADRTKSTFNAICFKYVYDALTAIGYYRTRVRVDSIKQLKQLSAFDVYDLYTSDDPDKLDGLVDYYGHYFSYGLQ